MKYLKGGTSVKETNNAAWATWTDTMSDVAREAAREMGQVSYAHY